MDEQDERHTSDAALRDVTSAVRLLDLALDGMADERYAEAHDNVVDALKLASWAAGNIKYLRDGNDPRNHVREHNEAAS